MLLKEELEFRLTVATLGVVQLVVWVYDSLTTIFSTRATEVDPNHGPDFETWVQGPKMQEPVDLISRRRPFGAHVWRFLKVIFTGKC